MRWIIPGMLATITAVIVWISNSRRAAARGWVYNRHNPRPPGSGTLGLLETIYQPGLEHVIEERSSEKARGGQDESGDAEDGRPTEGH